MTFKVIAAALLLYAAVRPIAWPCCRRRGLSARQSHPLGFLHSRRRPNHRDLRRRSCDIRRCSCHYHHCTHRRCCTQCRCYVRCRCSCRNRRTDPSNRANRCRNHPSSARHSWNRTKCRAQAKRIRNSAVRDARAGRKRLLRTDRRKHRRTGYSFGNSPGGTAVQPHRRNRCRNRHNPVCAGPYMPVPEPDAAPVRTMARSPRRKDCRRRLHCSRHGWHKAGSKKPPGIDRIRCWL